MKQIRGMRAGAAVVIACGLAAGCSGKESSVSSEPSVIGSPVGRPISSPAPSTTASPTITPSPSDDAPLIEQLKYELRRRTVEMAGTPGRTTATCDKDSVAAAKGAKVTCTVTYEGIKVTWPVTIQDPSFGGLMLSYKAEPSTGILTEKGAIADFWANQHDSGTDLRCDDMPEVKTVPLGKKTGYRCTYLAKDDIDDKPIWVTQNLIVRDNGPHFVV
ncbi:hypothetical protein ACFOOM_23110 [Streptomyces echinoruber]|uniref:hypothetical protein n=1 Tax=Streptomyces echinoruber TaxID=68898 RepID=UPI00167CF79F|nr:hypothetical protein [Streptomyces echinoruber]